MPHVVVVHSIEKHLMFEVFNWMVAIPDCGDDKVAIEFLWLHVNLSWGAHATNEKYGQ